MRMAFQPFNPPTSLVLPCVCTSPHRVGFHSCAAGLCVCAVGFRTIGIKLCVRVQPGFRVGPHGVGCNFVPCLCVRPSWLQPCAVYTSWLEPCAVCTRAPRTRTRAHICTHACTHTMTHAHALAVGIRDLKSDGFGWKFLPYEVVVSFGRSHPSPLPSNRPSHRGMLSVCASANHQCDARVSAPVTAV